METVNPRLPALGSFLRPDAQQVSRQVLALWDLQQAARLVTLPPALAQRYARLAFLDAPEVDAAYLWALTNVPELAQTSPVPAVYFDQSLAREAALDTLERTTVNLTSALVDNQYLLRAGLHAYCVRTDQRVSGLIAGQPLTSQGQWARLHLSATWSVAEAQQALPAERAAETRAQRKKAEDLVRPILAQAGQDQGQLRAIERLLEVAGILPARPPAAPDAPVTPPNDKAQAAPVPMMRKRPRPS